MPQNGFTTVHKINKWDIVLLVQGMVTHIHTVGLLELVQLPLSWRWLKCNNNIIRFQYLILMIYWYRSLWSMITGHILTSPGWWNAMGKSPFWSKEWAVHSDFHGDVTITSCLTCHFFYILGRPIRTLVQYLHNSN